MTWITYTIIAIVFIGVSDIFRKLTSNISDPYFANLLFQLGAVSAGIILFVLFSRKFAFEPRSTAIAYAGGFLIALFSLFSFRALALGPGASTVIPILRIGGIILAVILSIIVLKERLDMQGILGILFSLIGIYLLFSNK